MALKDNEGKKYTNEHPKFSIETNKAEVGNVKEATYRPGVNYRDLEKLPASSIKDKLEKKLGIGRGLSDSLQIQGVKKPFFVFGYVFFPMVCGRWFFGDDQAAPLHCGRVAGTWRDIGKF